MGANVIRAAVVAIASVVTLAAAPMAHLPDRVVPDGPGPADSLAARDLWTARWTDADGVERTGVTGAGVSVMSAEAYDTTHPDTDHCDDGVHHRTGAWYDGTSVIPDTYVPKGVDGGHGEVIAAVLCGSGHNSDGEYAGIAPEVSVWAYDGLCYARCDLRDWFTDPSLRVYTFSIEDDKVDAVDRMGYREEDDLLFVAAAGNAGGDGNESMTADFHREYGEDRLIVVAAANAASDGVASYSSRGAIEDPATWPEVAAPGCYVVATPVSSDGYIFSTNNYLVDVTSGPSGDCPYVDPSEYAELVRHGYAIQSGTSFAAPAVAAVVALMAQVAPDLTAADLSYLLTRTASPFLPSDDLDGDGEVSPHEFRQQHGWEAGWGLVDAEAAVAAAHWALLHPSASLDEAIACSHTATVDGTLVLNPDGTCVGS